VRRKGISGKESLSEEFSEQKLVFVIFQILAREQQSNQSCCIGNFIFSVSICILTTTTATSV